MRSSTWYAQSRTWFAMSRLYNTVATTEAALIGVALWHDIGGIVASTADWLLVDRMALGRGEGKPVRNVRYRWQVMTTNQETAYGFRSLTAARTAIAAYESMGVAAFNEVMNVNGMDYANFQ